YRGVYRDSAGAKRSVPGTFARKEAATRQAGKMEADEREMPTPHGSSSLTWGEWEPQWQTSRSVADSTKRSDEGRLRDHVRPRWRKTPLRDISADSVQRWVTDLTNGGMAASTVAKCYYLLSASLKAAHNARVIPANPCRGVSLPKPGPMPDRYLDDREVAAIRKSLPTFDKLVFDVLLGTGVRLGEAMALHWEDVNLERQEVAIEWGYDPVAQVMKPPKDHQRRTIPIGPGLSKVLAGQLASAGYGRRAPDPVKYPRNASVHTGLVLAHTNGRPFDPDNLRKDFNASVQIAYVGKGKQRHWIGHARLHDLRHTYASRLLDKSIPIEEVARLLGHANLSTTQRYAHRGKKQWDKVRAALG
ncbi:MAG: site-specific integrase, partial [Mycobacterium sp.]|nr:site-specific integrase [Mycobacterium sp.]